MTEELDKQQRVMERLKERWSAQVEDQKPLWPESADAEDDIAVEELALVSMGYPESGELNKFLVEVEQYIPILTPNPERASVRINARKLASTAFIGNIVQWLSGTDFDPESSTTVLEELEQRSSEVKLFRDLLKGLLVEVQTEMDELDKLIQVRLLEKSQKQLSVE